MKKIAYILLSSTILFSSCGRSSSTKIVFEKPEGYKEIIDNSVDPSTIQITTSDNPTSIVENKGNEPNDVMLGTWTGEMNGKKLTIIIEKISGKELIGYNILGPNKRNLKGTFAVGDWAQSCSKAYDAILNEPGDDKWDGVFTVKFVGYGDTNDETNECLGGKYQGTEGQGEWKSNNGKMKKEFNLTKATSPNNEQVLIGMIDTYGCGDADCSLNVKKENGKDYPQRFDFNYAKDGGIIINSEAKDVLLKNANGDYELNTKYKGKKVKLTCTIEKTYNAEMAENGMDGNTETYIVTKIE